MARLPGALRSRKGWLKETVPHLVYYQYNNVENLLETAERYLIWMFFAVVLAEHDLAGIVVSAFKHDARVDQEMPQPVFAKTARRICDETGAALILDDVRAGMRLSLDASWTLVNFQPDLTT